MTQEQQQKHNIKMLENIYDLLRLNHTTDKDNDTFADLTRKHGKEASQELKRFTRKKEMEIDFDNGILTIGKRFKLIIIN
jgi:hypothetical protein